jgi:hypothetical protein
VQPPPGGGTPKAVKKQGTPREAHKGSGGYAKAAGERGSVPPAGPEQLQGNNNKKRTAGARGGEKCGLMLGAFSPMRARKGKLLHPERASC